MKKIINKLSISLIISILLVPTCIYAEEEEEVITSGENEPPIEEVITSGDPSGDNGEEEGGENQGEDKPKLNDTALLGEISLSEGKLDKKLSDSNFEYKATVKSGIETITINATTKDKAKITASNFNLGESINLNEGNNDFTIEVESEDGQNKNTYKIVIIRATSNLNLKTLGIDGVKLNETFKPDKTDYTLTIAYNLKSINIKAGADDPSAKVSTSGTTNLSVGRNTVKVYVKNQAGETKEYRIIVTRLEEDEIVSSTIDDNNVTSDIELSDNTTSEIVGPIVDKNKDNNESGMSLQNIIVILICIILIIIAGIGIYFYITTGNSEKNKKRKIDKLRRKQSKIEEQLTDLMPVINEKQSRDYLKKKRPIEIDGEADYDNSDIDLENTIEMKTVKVKSVEEVKEISNPSTNILDDFDDLFIDE